MRCMKTKTTHGDKDPNPRNKYNLAPETARVGYKYGKYIWGVTEAPAGGDETTMGRRGRRHPGERHSGAGRR